MKIVILDGYCLNPGDLSWDGFKELGDCVIYDYTDASEVLQRAKDADVLITNKTVISGDMIRNLPRLKYIGVLATGYNVVDIAAAADCNIAVTNIPAYGTDSVAQMTFAHILNILHRIDHYTQENQEGKWQKEGNFCYWDTPLMELAGKKIGIVGMGNTGKAVGRIAKAFGMIVYAYTSGDISSLPSGTIKANLEVLFKECDIVTLHCPLTPDTKGFINKKLLDLMKPTAILINTARGQLINEADLAEALNNNVLYAAGVDVLSTEPPTNDNPLLHARSCFITPHIAWATLEARKRLMKQAENNLKAFLNGNYLNKVN